MSAIPHVGMGNNPIINFDPTGEQQLRTGFGEGYTFTLNKLRFGGKFQKRMRRQVKRKFIQFHHSLNRKYNRWQYNAWRRPKY